MGPGTCCPNQDGIECKNFCLPRSSWWWDQSHVPPCKVYFLIFYILKMVHKIGIFTYEEVVTCPSLQTEQQKLVNLNDSVKLPWLIRSSTRLQAYLWMSPKPMPLLCTILPSNLPHPWPHLILKLLSWEIFVDWLMTFSVAMWSRKRVPTAKFDERSLLCSKELKLLQNLISSEKNSSVWVLGLAWYIMGRFA